MSNRIRILATSDVHGTIFPYGYADNMVRTEGFARLNTLISSLRDENTLLLDNGDVLQGSAFTYFHYHRHPDLINPVTTVMREMGYDYINIGNHDFNYGPEALMMHLQNVKAPCITANFLWHKKPYGPTYVIREIAGKKIALIGAVTQYIVNWETKAHLRDIAFTDAFESVRKSVQYVRKFEKPDYVIVMYHGGFERDPETGVKTEDNTGEDEAYKMLNQIAGIDILITGHQHRSMSGKKNGIVYTQTAENGGELACIDIYPDSREITARLLKADTRADERITSCVQSEEDECQEWLDQVIGTSTVDMKITDQFDARFHKSQMVTFLNKVALEASKAEIASTCLFNDAAGFNKEITMRDLVNTYTFPNNLVVKKVTGTELKEYLEKTSEYWTVRADNTIGISAGYEIPKPKHYNYDMLDGIEYTIHAGNPSGNRVTDITYNGEPLHEEWTYRLVLNNYRANGGGDYFMLAKAPVLKTIPYDMVTLLADYILEHKVIDFEPVNNITVEH